MPDTHALVNGVGAASSKGFRLQVASGIPLAMEAVILAMVCASPWAYGAVHPGFEFLLDAGLGLLLLLWAARMLVAGQVTWQKCPVAVCLAGLFLLGIWQLTPLSPSLLEWLAPSTARLYDQLLPRQPEVLPFGQEWVDVNPAAGATLTLYPAATQRESLRLLAVFLLFAVVRNNVASMPALRRLSLAVLLNGSLLSLLALLQFFTSEHQTLYWSYPTTRQVFGPFLNRNHFAFYINLCLGLGVGLVLSRSSRGAADRFRVPAGSPLGPPPGEPGRLVSSLALLRDPPVLWACVAVALMLSTMVCCLSRGSFLALVGGALVCLCLCLLVYRSPRSFRPGAASLLVGAVAVVLATWFGFGPIKARLATFWQGEALQSRLPIWSSSLPIVSDFPVWGTGFGTYQYVETMYRTDARLSTYSYVHAHNDYLELLAEGGVPALALGVLAIGGIYWLGCRAVRRHKDQPTGGLVLGALFAFTTLVVHSFGEFGNHIPAITVLATVLCAQVCALGSAPDQGIRTPARDAPAVGAPDEYRVHLWGLGPPLGAAAILATGLLVCGAGWKAHRLDRLTLAAAQASSADRPDALRSRIRYLQAAVSLCPEDAEVQFALGYARLQQFEKERAHLEQSARLLGVATLAAGPATGVLTVTAHPAVAANWCWGLTAVVPRKVSTPEQERLTREELVPALRHYLRARDACPLLTEPHLGIAAHVDYLDKADPQGEYLRRAQLLEPADPEVWYICGLQELGTQQPEQAWASWRRSLELSATYLPEILTRSARLLNAEELVAKVVPGRPDVLVAAASYLYPEAEATAERRPFLEKALLHLPAVAETLPLQDLHLKALIYKSLGRTAESVEAYRALLLREPGQVTYRHELARVLYDAGRLEESRRELVIVLAQQPEHAAARELFPIVMRELAGRR